LSAFCGFYVFCVTSRLTRCGLVFLIDVFLASFSFVSVALFRFGCFNILFSCLLLSIASLLLQLFDDVCFFYLAEYFLGVSLLALIGLVRKMFHSLLVLFAWNLTLPGYVF